MSMTASIRVETRTTSGAGGEHRHDLRIGPQASHIDSSRSQLNSTPVPYLSPLELSSLCLDRRKARAERDGAKRQPRSMKRDAAIAIAGIVTFGKEAQPHIENLPPEEQDRLFQEAAQAVADKLGTSLDGLAVHRDESAIHAHFQMAGYGLDGNPVSKKMTMGMLSSLQDVGAKPFLNLGITRGEKIGKRVERGDDYSKTIHRSVRQLHSDLPKELEAAREKVSEMEVRVEKTETKLNQVREKLAQEESKNKTLEKERAKLEKRLKDYEKRLEDRTAELKRLSSIGKSKPQTKTGTLVEFGPKTLLGKRPIKHQKHIKYYPVKDMELWFGDVVRRANKARDAEKEALERASEAETRVDRLQKAIEPLLLDTATVGRPTEMQVTRIASKADFETYYSVIVQRTAEMVRVPPQKDKSPKQIAAALYRSSRENFDPKGIQFRVSSDEIAQEVIRMAIEDDHVMNVSFQDLNHQAMLQEAAEKAITEKRMGKPSTEKTSEKPSVSSPDPKKPTWSLDYDA